MPRLRAFNNARTTLAQDITAAANSFAVTSIASFPDPPFRITVEGEIMEVGLVNSGDNTFGSVQRGLEGTLAAGHPAGAAVENRFTAGTYMELAPQSVVDAHSADTVTMHGATPAATANRLIIRDAAGRAKVAAPAAADDIARKDTVDIVQANLHTHTANYTPHIPYVIAAGLANAYTVTLNPAPTSYIEGMALAVKINVDNTGASTIDVNNLGAKTIKKPNGNDVSLGNLKAGSIYSLRYNGINFILQGEGGGGTAQPADVLSGKTFTNDLGEQVGSMPNIGAVNITPSTINQQIVAGYHNGGGVVYGDPDLVAGNIKNGVNIFGVVGSFKGVLTQAQSSGTTPQSTTTQLFRIDGTGVAGSLSYSGWNLNNNDFVILSIVCDGVVAASSPPLYRGASGLLECFKYFESNSWVDVTVYGYVDVFDCVFTVRKL